MTTTMKLKLLLPSNVVGLRTQSALRNSTNKKKKTTTRCEVGDDVCGRSLLCYAIQRILVFIIDVMI